MGYFLSKEEFFSTLKGQIRIKKKIIRIKKMYILLKMRNLSALNDLYNVQDVIFIIGHD